MLDKVVQEENQDMMGATEQKVTLVREADKAQADLLGTWYVLYYVWGKYFQKSEGWLLLCSFYMSVSYCKPSTFILMLLNVFILLCVL